MMWQLTVPKGMTLEEFKAAMEALDVAFSEDREATEGDEDERDSAQEAK